MNQEFGKVGRNEPCPCGSGLRFKACHGSLSDQQSPREANNNPPEYEVIGFAPLIRQLFSKNTWSKDLFIDQIIPQIADCVGYISHLTPERKGIHLGQGLMHLRKVLLSIENDVDESKFNTWAQENLKVLIIIDAHIAYNAINLNTSYQVSFERAAQMITEYVLGPRLDEALTESKDGDPEMSLGIDFIEHVVSEIVD